MATSKLEQGEQFDGAAGTLRDSPWLTNEMISHTQDTIVQIEYVVKRKQVKFHQSNDVKNDYGSIKFVGAQRELGMNATIIHTLSALFGPMCKDWRNKWVALYVDHDVPLPGAKKDPITGERPKCSAVRIRAKRIDPPKVAPKAPDKPTGPDRADIPWEGAQQAS